MILLDKEMRQNLHSEFQREDRVLNANGACPLFFSFPFKKIFSFFGGEVINPKLTSAQEIKLFSMILVEYLPTLMLLQSDI